MSNFERKAKRRKENSSQKDEKKRYASYLRRHDDKGCNKSLCPFIQVPCNEPTCLDCEVAEEAAKRKLTRNSSKVNGAWYSI